MFSFRRQFGFDFGVPLSAITAVALLLTAGGLAWSQSSPPNFGQLYQVRVVHPNGEATQYVAEDPQINGLNIHVRLASGKSVIAVGPRDTVVIEPCSVPRGEYVVAATKNAAIRERLAQRGQ